MMSYAARSSRERSAGRTIGRAAVRMMGAIPQATRRRRAAPPFGSDRITAELPHTDLDAAIAGLRRVVGRLHERVAFTMRTDADQRRVEPGVDEQFPDGGRAFQSECGIGRGPAHRI